jgi:hypothetical protein
MVESTLMVLMNMFQANKYFSEAKLEFKVKPLKPLEKGK